MPKAAVIYANIMSGLRDTNIRFEDLRKLLLLLGFSERIKGDHFIYKRSDIPVRIVIQPIGNKAKAYQIKQIRAIFSEFNVEVDDV